MTGSEFGPGERIFLERLHRTDEWHDEIRITTVPRFKTSGLSGDEWRVSAHLEILRKGTVVFERDYHRIEDAARHLPWLLVVYAENGVDPDLTRGLCMQPGCRAPATVLYRKLADGCGGCGGTKDRPGDDDLFPKYRAFCAAHSRRGNSNLDDMDERYELVAGQPGEPSPDAVSPSVFAGAVELADLPGFLKGVRAGNTS